MADPAGPSLRVLLVAPASSGGIGAHVRDLAVGLRSRGHRVVVAAPPSTLTTFDLAAAADAVVAVPVGEWLGAVAGELRRLVRAADLVHAHGVRAGVTAGLAGAGTGARAGVPLVVTWHNAPLGGRLRRWVHAQLERLCARRADLILVASPDLMERARRAGAAAAAFVPVAAPHAAATPTASAPLDLRARAGGRLVVLCVARLHPQKRLDLLVEALANQTELHAFVVGDGPLRDRLAGRIAASSAPVTLLGRREDAATLHAQADLAVLPSDWEARPLALQEALRAGVATVCTDVGGVADLVGDAAIVVPPGDVPALRNALLHLARDPRRRAELAAAGVERAATWPTVDNTVDTVENKYLNLYQRRR
jgi:glycosyltransferase involved in cell wall biosynthesis